MYTKYCWKNIVEKIHVYKNIWHYDHFIMDYYWVLLDYTKLFDITDNQYWSNNIIQKYLTLWPFHYG